MPKIPLAIGQGFIDTDRNSPKGEAYEVTVPQLESWLTAYNNNLGDKFTVHYTDHYMFADGASMTYDAATNVLTIDQDLSAEAVSANMFVTDELNSDICRRIISVDQLAPTTILTLDDGHMGSGATQGTPFAQTDGTTPFVTDRSTNTNVFYIASFIESRAGIGIDVAPNDSTAIFSDSDDKFASISWAYSGSRFGRKFSFMCSWFNFENANPVQGKTLHRKTVFVPPPTPAHDLTKVIAGSDQTDGVVSNSGINFTSTAYTITDADVGRYVWFKSGPNADTGYIIGSQVGGVASLFNWDQLKEFSQLSNNTYPSDGSGLSFEIIQNFTSGGEAPELFNRETGITDSGKLLLAIGYNENVAATTPTSHKNAIFVLDIDHTTETLTWLNTIFPDEDFGLDSTAADDMIGIFPIGNDQYLFTYADATFVGSATTNLSALQYMGSIGTFNDTTNDFTFGTPFEISEVSEHQTLGTFTGVTTSQGTVSYTKSNYTTGDLAKYKGRIKCGNYVPFVWSESRGSGDQHVVVLVDVSDPNAPVAGTPIILTEFRRAETDALCCFPIDDTRFVITSSERFANSRPFVIICEITDINTVTQTTTILYPTGFDGDVTGVWFENSGDIIISGENELNDLEYNQLNNTDYHLLQDMSRPFSGHSYFARPMHYAASHADYERVHAYLQMYENSTRTYFTVTGQSGTFQNGEAVISSNSTEIELSMRTDGGNTYFYMDKNSFVAAPGHTGNVNFIQDNAWLNTTGGPYNLVANGVTLTGRTSGATATVNTLDGRYGVMQTSSPVGLTFINGGGFVGQTSGITIQKEGVSELVSDLAFSGIYPFEYEQGSDDGVTVPTPGETFVYATVNTFTFDALLSKYYGTMYCNTTDGLVYYHNGSSWAQMTTMDFSDKWIHTTGLAPYNFGWTTMVIRPPESGTVLPPENVRYISPHDGEYGDWRLYPTDMDTWRGISSRVGDDSYIWYGPRVSWNKPNVPNATYETDREVDEFGNIIRMVWCQKFKRG